MTRKSVNMKKKVRFAEGHMDLETSSIIINPARDRDTRRNRRRCSYNRPCNVESVVRQAPRSTDFLVKYICIISVVFVMLFGISMLIHYGSPPKNPQSCQCLIADTTENSEQPVHIHALVDTQSPVKCTAEGEEDCEGICVTLAKTSPSIYRELICETERNTDNFQGTLFYRLCSQQAWQLTSYQIEVCCMHGTEIKCNRDV